MEMEAALHRASEPAILYFGTPVVLISTVNQDGSYNLAPMSSAWWLGWRCVLGLAASSKTPQNMLRTRECVLNLPDAGLVGRVNRLARTTGTDPVPEIKQRRGYRHVHDKFGLAGLTADPSEIVAAPRVRECPVHLEATVEAVHPMAENDPKMRGRQLAFEVRIRRAHIEESILAADDPNRIDPDKWRPLIMSFQRFYGLADGELHASELARIPEALYRP